MTISGSAAIANVASPIYIRNTGTGVSTLQLSNNVTIAQNISLAGRNTNVPAIKTVSNATDTLAGDLTLAGGGSNYVLQCDVGTLNLGGTISAGSTATGARSLTLRGNGSFTISGSIRDGNASALSLVRTNLGTLTISGVNTYTGGTTNWGGILFVNSSLPGPLMMESGILSGTGSIAGDTTLLAGQLSPGSAPANAIGTLSFGGSLTLEPGCLTAMELNAGAQTNDRLNVAGTLNCAGTLYVVNLAGTLVSGQTFKLFNAGGYSGTFSTLLLPSLDEGLAWDTTLLPRNGTLSVATVPWVTISLATTNAECASTITLAATAGGTPPLSYQWFDEQTNAIAGATNAALILPQVTSAQAGNYTLVVTNNVGSASGLANVIVSDTTPPILTLSGSNPMTVECHSAFTDPGATALDACVGPVTVVATGSVDPNTTGGYTLTYTANDGKGNIATATRTVYVVGTTPPPQTLSITNLGGGQLQLNWGHGTLQRATNGAGPYSDIPGATPPYTIPVTNAQQFYRTKN